MIKIIILSCVLSLFLPSCGKVNTNPAHGVPVKPENGTDKPALTFQSYGLKGDGITDNTAALQKLIDESSEIYLKGGTYIINQTINLKAGIKIYGEATTVIKAGNSMSGTLHTHGRYFFGNAADLMLINGITFKQSDNAYNWGDWNNACVYLLNCKSTVIENSFFDFDLPYLIKGMEAVWISGTGSANNTIKNNKIKTLGIKYAENGADGTIVENNTLINAYSNAITANGNHPTDYSTNCQILNNTVTNAGRMGIEDWGKTEGTIIKGNKVTGTGKDPKQSIDGIAISAVGSHVKVISNVISDSQVYAIEVRGNYGTAVTNNMITDNPASTGIILNYTFPIPENISGVTRAMISHNKINKSDIGIHIFGDYEANVLIQGNTFTNTITKGISIESGSSIYHLDLEGNKFNFTVSTGKERFGLFSYTKFSPGTANQIINIATDTINYSASASGGTGIDLGFVIRTDKATISNVIVQGNNNKSAAGIPVNAITALGAKPIGVKLINNNVSGALVDLTGFTYTQSTGNNFK